MKSIVIFSVFLILTQGKVEAQSTSEGLQMEDMALEYIKGCGRLLLYLF